VVESNGFNDRTWLDGSGHPIRRRCESPNATGERTSDIWKSERPPGPRVYSKPWTIALNAQLAGDTELIEYVCNENPKTISSIEHWVGKASDAKRSEVKVAPEILAKYAGTYHELDIWNGGPIPRTIEITTSDGALFAELKGRGRVQLAAQSPTTFTGFLGWGSGSWWTAKAW